MTTRPTKALPSAKAVLKEKARRRAYPEAVEAALAQCFDKQHALINSPRKRKVTHTGRRGGKTGALTGAALKATVDYPGKTVIVVERTLSCQAADAFWKNLQELDTKLKLGFRWQHTLRIATAPNGSVIQLMGADTKEAVDKIRGGKTPLLIVDEVGAYRDDILRYLIVEAAPAATVDFNGTVILAGTPRPRKKGFFYDKCVSPETWECFHWTLHDNPYIPDRTLPEFREWTDAECKRYREDWLTQERLDNGWTEQSSAYRREYLGEWCEHSDDLVFEYSDHNLYDRLPDGDWQYFLAVDVGITDPCAITVIARSRDVPEMYVLESYEEPNMIISTLAARLELLFERYRFAAKCIDAGGQGKAWQAELAATYGIHLDNAEKSGKALAIASVNGDFRTGRLRLLRAGTRQLREDMDLLSWNADRTDYAERADGEKLADHTCDSLVYAARLARQWATTTSGDREKPRKGTPEWHEAQEREMIRAAEEEYLRQQRGPDYDDDPYCLGLGHEDAA